MVTWEGGRVKQGVDEETCAPHLWANTSSELDLVLLSARLEDAVVWTTSTNKGSSYIVAARDCQEWVTLQYCYWISNMKHGS